MDYQCRAPVTTETVEEQSLILQSILRRLARDGVGENGGKPTMRARN